MLSRVTFMKVCGDQWFSKGIIPFKMTLQIHFCWINTPTCHVFTSNAITICLDSGKECSDREETYFLEFNCLRIAIGEKIYIFFHFPELTCLEIDIDSSCSIFFSFKEEFLHHFSLKRNPYKFSPFMLCYGALAEGRKVWAAITCLWAHTEWNPENIAELTFLALNFSLIKKLIA